MKAGPAIDVSVSEDFVKLHGPLEEVEIIPQSEKDADPMWGLRLKCEVGGTVFDAYVVDIEVTKVSRERLYLVKYVDGDVEHLTASEVRACADAGEAERAAHRASLRSATAKSTSARPSQGRTKHAAPTKRPAMAKAAPTGPRGDAKILKKPAKRASKRSN